MKILSLYIEGYKMFNPSQKIKFGKDLNLLIGINGSGKSTILEAIAIIFNEVREYCKKPKIYERKFNFEIEYTFNKSIIIDETTTTQNSNLVIHKVFLSSSKGSGLQYTMTVDDILIESTKEIYQYLPDDLIFYYAGACETLERIIDQSEVDQLEDLFQKKSENSIQKAIENIIKNIVYIKKQYFPILFLLNYIDQKTELPFSKKKFSIRNISFEYQQYSSTKSTDYKNLYNLSGFLRQFVDNLLIHTFNGVEYDEDEKIAYFNIDYHRGLFDAIEDLENLTDEQKYNESNILLFHFISLLFRIGFLKKIHVALNDENGNVYKIDDLSEGEQQLITLESIKKNLCKLNTVLFLDEPDAYLHPQRQRQILPHLKELFSSSYTQIIATTHSPFVVQSVKINQVIHFDKGKVNYFENEILDYKAIINSLFGVNGRFNTDIEVKINEFNKYREMILKEKEFNIENFKTLVNEIIGFGEETRVLISRELAQLKRLKNFSIDE